MRLPANATVAVFACAVLDIGRADFRREVQTILLNNRVVDDPDTCRIVDGDVLVLSGAMPGLVGAMLRSDSPIKALRQTISDHGTRQNTGDGSGTVTVKFFNTILKKHVYAIRAYGFTVPETSNDR